ncbi:MarR family transcriptional regulator [Nocardia panacis]|uniref:MarR family transcriptional regulator n=1 Tax=Nocardia panacis TaxID=2340916 RepID=A0A3A4KT60_9NOCA|nr:MarR family transcriptional regulator [Nocardia panacis]RJO72943.1 MarR family transcriptional regulator [Nocardia panacis]
MHERTDQAADTSQEKLRFVEDLALVFERMGLVRMTGRTVGWLLVAEPPEQTFGQIAEALQASKGSISNALKTLVTMRWVNKISNPGDRRDYYVIRPGILPELMRQQSGMYTDMTDTIGRGLRLFDDPAGAGAARVREIHEFMTWIGREMPALIERWYAEHGS